MKIEGIEIKELDEVQEESLSFKVGRNEVVSGLGVVPKVWKVIEGNFTDEDLRTLCRKKPQCKDLWINMMRLNPRDESYHLK